MTILALLIPLTLLMGVIGLGAFFWSLGNGQYDDLEGDAERILLDDGDAPLPARPTPTPKEFSTFCPTLPFPCDSRS